MWIQKVEDAKYFYIFLRRKDLTNPLIAKFIKDVSKIEESVFDEGIVIGYVPLNQEFKLREIHKNIFGKDIITFDEWLNEKKEDDASV